jgi:hypothetical protein
LREQMRRTNSNTLKQWFALKNYANERHQYSRRYSDRGNALRR